MFTLNEQNRNFGFPKQQFWQLIPNGTLSDE
jgi:hypothetical protein